MSFPYVLVFPLPADSSVSASTAPYGTPRLAQYIRGKERMESIIAVVRQQTDELRTVFAQLKNDRYTAGAFGAQLDVLGGIVGQPRNGLDDDAYRRHISARILLNRSSGTVEEIYQIIALVSPAGTTFTLEDFPPASFLFSITDLPGPLADAEETAEQLARTLTEARAAGVGANLLFSVAPFSGVMQFDDGPGLDVGRLAGVLST